MFLLVYKLKTIYNNKCFLCCILSLNFVIIVNKIDFSIVVVVIVCLRLRDRDRCSTADGSGSCHAPAPLYFEEMTRCRRQKLHCRQL